MISIHSQLVYRLTDLAIYIVSSNNIRIKNDGKKSKRTIRTGAVVIPPSRDEASGSVETGRIFAGLEGPRAPLAWGERDKKWFDQ